ncbi:vacuolar transporter chaperone [Apophysomyces sp. BC1034]|nr:vacuolar transporter chaperone [Apophysomyces sp. BC1015]KAG0181063.1 vacuolar transporter chaperone [Apophysomyces sp. BC1021]KAG0191470.1 vacuolar transporter chaperone [Apophysomyces sp. BC1034]
MKFGAELNAKLFPPWRTSYFQYNEFKHNLKKRQLDHGWTDKDEREFVDGFERELGKVYRFVDDRLRDLNQRVEQSDTVLRRIVARDTQQYDAAAETLTDILFDVKDLDRFHQLNSRAFEKMIKKHDRYTQRNLRSGFIQMLERYPLDKLHQPLGTLIIRLSSLHDRCRLYGRTRDTQAYSQGGQQTAFERATAKYWVHPDNVTEVKAIILLHLPVHVFNQKKEYEADDAAVSSVYLDNPAFDLYSERLERTEGAEAIRVRWYGPEENNNNIYIERKTHHAPWLGGHSVKDRFRLKEPMVNSFLHGIYSAEDYRKDLIQKGKMDPVSIEDHHFVAKGIQESIQQRRLAPVCRVFYNRTAFQLPGDQRLRLSLDCDLTYIREDDLDGRPRRRRLDGTSRMKENWRRTDVGINHPFRSVDPADVLHFPYAVLETKIQTHLGQDMPNWLTTLVNSHLVHEVPRFSKYLHGAAMLYRVPSAPWWLDELAIDIRKPPQINIGLTRSTSLRPLVNGHHRQSLYDPHVAINLFDPTAKKERPDLFSRVFSLKSEKALPPLTQPNDKDDAMPRGRSTASVFSRAIKRTEPKTYFANERTFISWLQFCALLLTVALNLLNMGDYISRIIGAVFIIISSLLSFYALGRFQIRAWQLRTGRNIIRYDDVYGPTVLCVLMVTALLVNFYLRAPTFSSSQ